MTTQVGTTLERGYPREVEKHDAMRWVVPIGRLFLAAIFLLSAPSNFSKPAIEYAGNAGVPLAQIAVPLAGVIALVGALLVLFGYRARIGAWLLVLFLVPVTLFMHRFWDVSDPAVARLQEINFMKNLAILGGALLVTYFGAGPVSLDEQRLRARRA
jgi:putative oxidoreductase